jgi:hypothetical protein
MDADRVFGEVERLFGRREGKIRPWTIQKMRESPSGKSPSPV